MKNAQLKQDALPSVWPRCPAHLTKTKSEQLTSVDHESALPAHELEVRQDTFSLLDELVEKNHFAFRNICTEEKLATKMFSNSHAGTFPYS